MYKTHKPFLQAILGQKVKSNPIWLMRQAGRYLPEYRDIRGTVDDFLTLCLTPKVAAEITMQPIRRFGFDAAILFADILLIPHALGQKMTFESGFGPVLEPVRDLKALACLGYDHKRMEPVFETMALLKGMAPPEVARIGFCGGLWTVACYVIDGTGKKGFLGALNAIEADPEFLQKLMDLLFEATFQYLCGQIEAGAEVIQIFDSWAGLLSGPKFRKWVIEPTKRLVLALEAKYPEIPIIGFPRGCSNDDYCAFVNETGIDVLGIDQKVPLSFAVDELQSVKPLQGNLDPEVLVRGGVEMQNQVALILEKLGPSHLFNLGHGVLPQTPVEHVAELVRLVRMAEWQKE